MFEPSIFRCKLAGFVSGRGLVPDGVPDPYFHGLKNSCLNVAWLVGWLVGW